MTKPASLSVAVLLGVLVFTVFILTSHALAQHPIPPGIRQADQTEVQTQKNIPPPASPRVTVDYAKLKHDADELAALAQSIPPAVDQTNERHSAQGPDRETEADRKAGQAAALADFAVTADRFPER